MLNVFFYNYSLFQETFTGKLVLCQNYYFQFSIFSSLNSGAGRLKAKALATTHAMVRGRKQNFNSVTDQKIEKMMEITFQERTEAKIKWALNCYNDWRVMRLAKVNCQQEIYDANLNDLSIVTKENLEFALCRFICEVKKSKDDSDYPGKTLYQMVCAIRII